MRIAAVVLGAFATAGLDAAAIGGTDFGGSPNQVGAGPRAAAMGNAFVAVADDATANTWNPAGMTQLERPEGALSVGLYQRDTEPNSTRGGDDRSDLDLDHVSAVFPFFALGAQQSIGIAWQRRLDFVKRTGVQPDPTITFFGSGYIVNESITDYDQEGAYSSVSLSYAAEPLPGLSFGFTASSWDDDLTGNSSFEGTLRKEDVASQFDTSDVLQARNTTTYTETTEATVDGGYDIVLGSLWRIDATWNLALVYRPAFELDVIQTASGEEVVTDINGVVVGTNQTELRYETTLQLPSSIALGTSWRYDDRITISADITRTDWSEFEQTDRNGQTFSPINANVDPEDFDPGWAVRVGFEQVFILPRLVLIGRCGAFYEGLPATTTAKDAATASEVEATIDDWYGVTAGGSIYLRRVLYDLAVLYRRGDDVGSSTETVAFDSVDVAAITVRAGVTVQF